MTAIKKSKRLSLVDFYRAFAIFLILLFHGNQIYNNKFEYDWFNISSWDKTGGVNFFFIVSGFMIYYLYHKDIGKIGKSSAFLLKRAIRIYPLYALFSLAAILICIVAPQLANQKLDLWIIIKTFLFIPLEPALIESTWSLNHIVLFYLLFSLVVFKPTLFKPVFALWILGTILLLVNNDVFSFLDPFLFNYHNLEIASGAFIAYLILHFQFNIYGARTLLTVGIVGYFLVYLNNFYKQFEIVNQYFYGTFAALIMFGIVVIDLKKERELNKTIKLLTNSSYAMYISHTLFINFYVTLFKMFSLQRIVGHFLSLLLIIILTIGSGCVVYLIAEKPITLFLKNILFKNKEKDQTINKVAINS